RACRAGTARTGIARKRARSRAHGDNAASRHSDNRTHRASDELSRDTHRDDRHATHGAGRVSRARRSKLARNAPGSARTTPRPRTTRTRTLPRVVYAQVAPDDADARIAEALKLLARAGAFDA